MSYATASIIERFIEAIKRRAREAYGRRKTFAESLEIRVKTSFREESFVQSIITAIVRVHNIFSREESIIRFFRSIGSAIQKLQCSLEDSLSILSLLLEFLSVISIILILVIAWWS